MRIRILIYEMTRALQTRSRATEQRILNAAERLLRVRRFEDISMNEIAAEAGVSIGGIYARFASKEALLKTLHTRYEVQRTEQLGRTFDPALWAEAGLETRVRGAISALVTLMREHRHILRTFLLRYWSRPDTGAGPFNERLEDLYRRAIEVILRETESIGASDPERAARLTLAMVAGACRDMIVMKPAPAPGAIDASDDELIDSLTRAALGILQARPEGSSR